MDVKTQGLSFPAVSFVAGERLSPAQFSRALQLDDPLMTSTSAARASGLRGRVITPAMLGFHLGVSADALVDRLGFTWGRTLNLGIDLDWAGHIVTEEDMVESSTSVVAAGERATREGRVRQFARLRTDFAVEQQLVCRCEVLFTELRDGEPDLSVPYAADSAADAPTFPYVADRTATTTDDVLPMRETPATSRLSMARVSVATDNPDPLHLDDDVARAAGFGAVVGHGATVLELLHEPARRVFGLGVSTRLETRQVAPYGLGDILLASGSSSQTGPGTVACQTTVANQTGQTVGSATIAIGAIGSRS